MDTYKIITIIVYCLFPSVASAAVYNLGSGALLNSPGGLMGYIYKESQTKVESGRIRTTPKFTFATSQGKQVGFTASRLSDISTGRVGQSVVKLAKAAGPVGIGLLTAELICTETDICANAEDWLFGKEFDLVGTPPSCADISIGQTLRWVNGFDRTFEYERDTNEVCGGDQTGRIAFCPQTTSDCIQGEIIRQTDLGLGNANEPAREPTEEDWDNAAPLLNNDAFAQPLLDAGEGVPVEAPDLMAPQNFITNTETTTLKDDQGNITGSQVTERTVSITDVSDAANPSSFDIEEKKTVTSYDVNNNVTNSETTVINNEQPAQTDDQTIEFDTVEPATLENKDIELPFDVTSWGGGSCPSDIEIVTSFGTFQYNVTPLCDYAVAIKPFVLLIASVTGAMILIGAHRATA